MGQITKIQKKYFKQKDQIDSDMFKEILAGERNIVFDIKFHRNCLIDNSTSQDQVRFMYVYQQNHGIYKTVQFDYDEGQTIVSNLKCSDKTGVYEFIKLGEKCMKYAYDVRSYESLIWPVDSKVIGIW